MPERHRPRPHPFFAVFLVALLVGVVAAVLASGLRPSWALRSTIVYRSEIGLAVGGFVYLVSTTAWLAWQGKYVPLRLPFGTTGAEGKAVDAAADQLEVAATEMNAFRKEVDLRFTRIEDALENVTTRLQALEAESLR
jgi:ABC-type nickel/cobalt efflux system permease component RcnA